MWSFFNRHQKILRWIPALCLAIAIFVLSAISGEKIGQSSERLAFTLQTISTAPVPAGKTSALAPAAELPAVPAFLSFLELDWLKTGHAIGYFLLGLAVLYALPERWRWSAPIALLICSLYGASDEFHQVFIPGRSASFKDILIDTIAASIGVAVMLGMNVFLKSKRAATG